jgi:hypothetical protein
VSAPLKRYEIDTSTYAVKNLRYCDDGTHVDAEEAVKLVTDIGSQLAREIAASEHYRKREQDLLIERNDLYHELQEWKESRSIWRKVRAWFS